MHFQSLALAAVLAVCTSALPTDTLETRDAPNLDAMKATLTSKDGQCLISLDLKGVGCNGDFILEHTELKGNVCEGISTKYQRNITAHNVCGNAYGNFQTFDSDGLEKGYFYFENRADFKAKFKFDATFTDELIKIKVPSVGEASAWDPTANASS